MFKFVAILAVLAQAFAFNPSSETHNCGVFGKNGFSSGNTRIEFFFPSSTSGKEKYDRFLQSESKSSNAQSNPTSHFSNSMNKNSNFNVAPMTKNLVAKGKYSVALQNYGPAPDKKIPVHTSHVRVPLQEKPTVRLPTKIPSPKTIAHSCTCYKTIVKPHVHQTLITVPSIQRYIETTHKPVVENIHYEAYPIKCPEQVPESQGQAEEVSTPQNIHFQTLETSQSATNQVQQFPAIKISNIQSFDSPQTFDFSKIFNEKDTSTNSNTQTEIPNVQFIEPQKPHVIEIPRIQFVEAKPRQESSLFGQEKNSQNIELPPVQIIDAQKPQVIEIPRYQIIEAQKPQPIEMTLHQFLEPQKNTNVEFPKIQFVEPQKSQTIEIPRVQLVEAEKFQAVEMPRVQGNQILKGESTQQGSSLSFGSAPCSSGHLFVQPIY